MTKERLQSLPLEELKRFAERHRIDVDGSVDREALIGLLLEFYQELEEEREEVNNLQIKGEAKKYRIGPDDELVATEDPPPIPDTYDETKIVAMVRGPSWAFAYWEIKEDKLKQLRKDEDTGSLLLRVHDTQGVRFNGKNSNEYFDIPLKLTDRKWYINLPTPGSQYVLELIFKKRNKDHLVARSNEITTPPGTLSDHSGNGQVDEKILMMSLQQSMREMAASGAIPQRILSVSN